MVDQHRISSLTPTELKAVRANLVTEHFGFSPEAFAKTGMDIANECMYAAVDAGEQLIEVHASEDAALDPDEVQRGIYKLETLLENAIDKHFDLYEIYVLRNTFSVPTELIPFIRLAHQDSIDLSLKDADKAALEEYHRELEAYEAELARGRALMAAKALLERRADDASDLATEVGHMSSADPLSSKTKILLSQLTGLHSALSSLLDTPAPPISSEGASESGEPWGNSRSAYINWASSEKVGLAKGEPEGGDGIGKIGDIITATGSIEDAQALLSDFTGGTR